MKSFVEKLDEVHEDLNLRKLELFDQSLKEYFELFCGSFTQLPNLTHLRVTNMQSSVFIIEHLVKKISRNV